MNSLNNTKSEENKSICDGRGCFKAATTKIDEAVSETGRIVLNLCDDCFLKFRK